MRRRTAPRDRLVELPGGGKVLCPAWSSGSRGVVAVGLNDYREQMFVLRVLRPGDVVLDIGAHCGIYTALMASRGAVVHAFEPAERARTALRRTVAANAAADRVQVHAVALSDFQGSAYLTDDLDSGNHLVARSDAPPASALPVPVDTLDGWASGSGVTQPWLVKIDAEGADEAVLRGGSGILGSAAPALIVEYWNGGTGLRALLAEQGYQTFRFDVAQNTLEPFDLGEGDGNLIACTRRRGEQVQERLQASTWRGARPASDGLSAAP